ncbi:MAG: hypothetical protein HFE63_00080 [Clostridiales bacterium]|nr:hypothetical protein [Clostridiales bacterium]
MSKKRTGAVRVCAAAILTGIIASSTSCGFIVFNDPDSTSAPISDSRSDVISSDNNGDTSESGNANTEKTDPRESADKRLEALPDRNLSSANIIIATTDNETICPFEAENEIVAARSVATRAVEDKYYTHIITNQLDHASMLNVIKEAYASDMYYADLIAIPQSQVGMFWSNGILANMYSLPYTDYSKEYYDQKIISEAIIGNELRAVSGAANFNPEYLSCVYFNRGLIEKYSLENPYDLVYSGKWTWDKLGELAKAVQSDVNGSTGISGHGAGIDTSEYIDIAAIAMGIDYVSNPEQALPELNYMSTDIHSARANEIVNKLYKLLYSDNTLAPADTARSLFTSDSLLFYTDRLYLTTWMPNSNVSWGILPMPKYDESQNGYISLLSSEAPVFCAVAGTPSYENSGLILEALNASYYEYVLDVYMNDRINYYLRDNESINMLEIVINSASTDFAHMYASGFTNLANATYSAIYGAVTTRSSLDTLYKRYQTAATTELSKSVKIYE